MAASRPAVVAGGAQGTGLFSLSQQVLHQPSKKLVFEEVRSDTQLLVLGIVA